MAVTVFKKPFNNGQDNLIDLNGGVSSGVTELLFYIQLHPGQRASNIAKGLNLPLRTVERGLKKLGYPLKPGHLKVSMGYEQQDDEPFLAKEVRPFGQPTFQKGQGIGC